MHNQPPRRHFVVVDGAPVAIVGKQKCPVDPEPLAALLPAALVPPLREWLRTATYQDLDALLGCLEVEHMMILHHRHEQALSAQEGHDDE